MANNSRWLQFLSIVSCLCGTAADGAALEGGRLAEVVGNVHVSEHGTPPVAAHRNAPLHDSALRTGQKSRAELAFTDRTILRVGDNTQFAFASTSRTLNLTTGAVLVQVPAGPGSTELRVRGITATVTGTTLLAECLPQAYAKFICLDGTSRLCLKDNGSARDCVLLRPGEMVIAAPDAKILPESVDVDLSRLVQTCELITKFAPLPGHQSVLHAAANQRKFKSQGNLVDSGLVIFGRGNLVSRSKPANRAQAVAKPIRAKRERTMPE